LTARLLVPLDDRPCTRDFPGQLAPLVGWSLERPPDVLLGSYTRGGAPDALIDWLAERADSARSAILSLDMLVFGGLVASRAYGVDADTAKSRLDRIAPLVHGADVFSIVMRVPPFCTSDEDRRFSDRLLELSRSLARAGGRPGPLARFRLAALERRIPAEFLARYRAARARNHMVNRTALEWARRGTAAFVLIGMDDSKTEGFNVSERDALIPQLAAGRSDLLPGADEIALLLLARRALQEAGRFPRLAVGYSPPHLGARVTRYEDRPVAALIEAHARVLGVELAEAKDADVHLFVHGPSRGQQEAATQLLPCRPGARHRSFARQVAEVVERGGLAAVADLGYANGGDRALLAALGEAVELPRLAAFAAWNTAGNTIGTVLAHAALRWLSRRSAVLSEESRRQSQEATAAHLRFLLERFLDDTLYQAGLRNEIGLRLTLERANIYDLKERHREVEATVARQMETQAQAFFSRHFEGRTVDGLRINGPLSLHTRLPWPRIFELDIRTELALTASGPASVS
jgi:hypothetical protein